MEQITVYDLNQKECKPSSPKPKVVTPPNSAMTAIPRSKTSYDYYGDQLEDDYFQDTRDYIPIQGRQTPIGMVRPCSPGGPSFGGERQSRPRSRNVRSRGVPPSMPARSLSMVEGQAMDGFDDNPYTQPMDPINKQYYYKKWRANPPQPQAPIYREGRLGSPWRHIKACINNAGNHLVFIDGTIKSEENFFYPPEDQFKPPNFSLYVSPRMPRRATQHVPMTYRPRGDSSSSFHERARQGFKYWYHQPKPIDLASRYRQKARMLTLGPSCSN